jgi:hypothetical protein
VSEADATRRSLLTRWPILRRLPLLGLIGGAAWFISASHGEHIMVRYRLAHDPNVVGLKAQISRGGQLYRSSEWRYDRGAPDEQLQDIELQPGDYLVEAQALGRHKPDPQPLHLHIERDGSHEAFMDFP